MPSPFPGMDPYLEHPFIFPDLHDSLITYLREAVNLSLPAPYHAHIGSRVWVESAHRHLGPDVHVLRPPRPTTPEQEGGGVAIAETVEVNPVVVHVPDDEMREPFIDIYVEPGNKRLVTTMEVLSPSNKTAGVHGRELYLAKQREILDSNVHLVEIDLLRAGIHSTAVPHWRAVAQAGPFDYHVCVRRFDTPADYVVYAIRLPQRLPTIYIPLLPGDEPVQVNLQAVFARCYEMGRYDRSLDYTAPIVPPLSQEQAAWAERIVTAS